MPDRVQVKDLYKDQQFAPRTEVTARPVDTFVGPAKPVQDIRLLELARAFSDVQPGLTKFANERIDHSNEIDVEEGQKAALANKAQFKEAINSGAIPAGVSPWFKVGWERQRARLDSHSYNQSLQEAYASSDLPTKDDPQAVQSFMADFTAKWLQSNPSVQENPEFNRTFSVMSSKAQEGLAQQHAVERVKAVEQETYDNTDRELGLLLADHNQDLLGISEPNPRTAALVSDLVKAQIANGLNGTMANKLVANAVIRQAVADNDISVLDLLDQIPAGSGTVGQIGYVKDDVMRARDAITSGIAVRDRHAKASKELNTKEAIQSIQNEANLQILKDPRADLSRLFTKMSAVDADEANKMIAHQSAYLSAMAAKDKIAEDPIAKGALYLDAINGNLTQDEAYKALGNGIIDADTFKDLITNTLPKAKEHRSKLSDPTVTTSSAGLRKVILGNEEGFNYDDARYALADQADFMFKKAMLKWFDQNPNASDLQAMEEAEKTSAFIQRIPAFRPDATALPDAKESLKGNEAPGETPRSYFKDIDALKKGVEEYKTTGKGELKKLSDLTGISVNDLAVAQARSIAKQEALAKAAAAKQKK